LQVTGASRHPEVEAEEAGWSIQRDIEAPREGKLAEIDDQSRDVFQDQHYALFALRRTIPKTWQAAKSTGSSTVGAVSQTKAGM
jgi:hypothetical protein